MSKARYKMSKMASFFIWLTFLQLSTAKITLSKGDVPFEKVQDDYYTLKFDENNDKMVLFKILGAEGNIGVFPQDQESSCSDVVYGSIVNQTMLFLNQSLDYERPECRKSKNTLRDLTTGSSVTFEIQLNNLDDNAPQFEMGTNNCLFKENMMYIIENSTCIITMSDRDGMMNKAKLEIEVGDTTLFGVDFYPFPHEEDTTAFFTIHLLQTLDYETSQLYVLKIKAQEQVNSGEVQVAINVEDQPDRPPKFTKMITAEQFEENVDQTFIVKAIDGDLGINSSISYRKTHDGCDKFTCKITISETDGVISVEKVDREETGDTISLTIEAVEEDDLSATPLDIMFFILDQDDEVPEINLKNNIVKVEEGFKGTITKFSVKDMDLSDNGTYTISMDKGKSATDYSQAFEVIPDTGYQSADIILTVVNSTLLDYEDENWKVIKFNIIATEKADETHIDSKQITINLKDINDEPPIFVDKSDSVDIYENISANVFVFNACAVDRDAGDIVTYEILGIWNRKLDISDKGIITTKETDVFDYELLQEVQIAINAADNLRTHVTSKTLTINVLDVDDEPPVMRVSITTKDKMATIEENSPSGTVVEGLTITVTDPDTKPFLKLEIDWSETYVTKNSRIVTLDEDVYQCFSVESTTQKIQSIQGTITINENCSPDFEKFNSVVLYLVATDINTVKGDNFTKASVTINIIDVNDNKPQFIDTSLENLVVTDGTKIVTKIGTVTAKDEDIGDKLTFTIKPLNDEQPDWIRINEDSGELTVKEGIEIDCDEPPRPDIRYNITVHDGDPTHDTTAEVSIRIEDVNDESPIIDCKETEVHIIEQSVDGTKLDLNLKATDKDRDVPFHTIIFKFETNLTDETSDRFSINVDGLVSVRLRNGASLDRDKGPASFYLPIVAYDNPNGTLQLRDHFDVKVVLDDLDNNIPVLETKSLQCMENVVKGQQLGDIVAVDPDEDGPNSNVFFELRQVFPLEEQNEKVLDNTFFKIAKTDAKTATINIIKDLKKYWGKFNITIRTRDEGNKEAFLDNNITLTVDKFNFLQPVFDFPKTDEDKKILIDKDLTNPKSDIYLPNSEKLKNFVVDDQQDHKWDVTFDIKDEEDDSNDLFRIIKPTSKSWEGALQTTRSVTDDDINKLYSMTVRASVKTDMKDGEASVFVETTLKIRFFSYSEQPVFKVQKDSIRIEENVIVKMDLPQKASFSDPDIADITPHYFIVPQSDTFQMDSDNGQISLLKMLDYEEKNQYELKIAAMNKNSYPAVIPSDQDSNVLSLTVKVIDMNDHEPIFTPSKITGALLRSDSKGTPITTVNATDGDPTLQDLTYKLKDFECSKTSNAPEIPFEIGDKDGKITSNFAVTSDMSGFCKFLVEVTDEPDEKNVIHTVSTTVQIYIISDDELVTFTFLNEDWFVQQKQDAVVGVIDEAFKDYGYHSFLADMTYDQDWHNSTAHFFFLNSKSEPVPASEILGNLTDPNKYSALSTQLESFGVHLHYFSEQSITKDVDDYVKIWLIVGIIVLGSLLALLTVTFFFRNRALTRRINNLSTTKFGSQESGLNRAGVTAPTTNKNAIEGSNPVFNSENYIKEVEDDRNSIMSGDSDLLGVENNPDFDI